MKINNGVISENFGVRAAKSNLRVIPFPVSLLTLILTLIVCVVQNASGQSLSITAPAYACVGTSVNVSATASGNSSYDYVTVTISANGSSTTQSGYGTVTVPLTITPSSVGNMGVSAGASSTGVGQFTSQSANVTVTGLSSVTPSTGILCWTSTATVTFTAHTTPVGNPEGCSITWSGDSISGSGITATGGPYGSGGYKSATATLGSSSQSGTVWVSRIFISLSANGVTTETAVGCAKSYSVTATGGFGSYSYQLYTPSGVGPVSANFNVTAPSSPGSMALTITAFDSFGCSSSYSWTLTAHNTTESTLWNTWTYYTSPTVRIGAPLSSHTAGANMTYTLTSTITAGASYSVTAGVDIGPVAAQQGITLSYSYSQSEGTSVSGSVPNPNPQGFEYGLFYSWFKRHQDGWAKQYNCDGLVAGGPWSVETPLSMSVNPEIIQ